MHRRKWICTALALMAALIAGIAGYPAWKKHRAEGMYRDALSAGKSGDLRRLAAAAKDLSGIPGFEEKARYLRADFFVRSGDNVSAIQALALPPRDNELLIPMLLLQIEAHYRAGQFAEAESFARRLLKESPDNVTGHRWLASVLYDLGANQAAITELRTVVRLAPHDYGARHLLGVIHADDERFSEAAEFCRQALDQNPPPPVRRQIVEVLMKSLVRLHDYDGALKAFEDFEHADKDHGDAALTVYAAESHWSLGRHDEAQRLLQRAESLQPDDRDVLLLKARILLESGDAEIAIERLDRILERDPHDFESRYRLALAYRRLQQGERYQEEIARMEASQLLRRRLTDLSEQAVRQPRDPEVRDRLAEVCDSLGKHELAKLYRQAAEACRRAAGAGNR